MAKYLDETGLQTLWSKITNKITTLDGNVVKLTSDQTVNGVKTFNAPANSDGTEQTTMKIKTANGGAIIFGKEGPNSGSMIRLDQTDGTTRLQFRASSTPGAMVWKQPESGAALYFDFGPNATRTTMPTSGGTLAYTSQIPTKLKNPHALTFGKKTYDGSSAQTITASDLGALTSHQSLADYAKKSDLASVSQTVSSNTSKITTLQGYFNADGQALLAVSASHDADVNEITTTYANQVDLDNTNATLSNKQDKLVSGNNLKTINGNSLLGSGNITINTSGTIDSALSTTSTNPVQNKVINNALSKKQSTLVSGTNIKTINNNSILGSGNLSITASVPTEVAKLVNSGGNYIQIERYGSNNYGMRIQTGKVSVNKAETIHTEVKFSNPNLFSKTPVVIITPLINNTTDTRQIDTELTGVTEKGFHFSCALGNTSYRITEVHYIAIQLI